MRFSIFSDFRLIIAALLLIGLLDLPYAYYTVLRWAVVSGSGMVIYSLVEQGNRVQIIAFVVAAFVFLFAHMSKADWRLVDAATATLFVWLYVRDTLSKG